MSDMPKRIRDLVANPNLAVNYVESVHGKWVRMGVLHVTQTLGGRDSRTLVSSEKTKRRIGV